MAQDQGPAVFFIRLHCACECGGIGEICKRFVLRKTQWLITGRGEKNRGHLEAQSVRSSMVMLADKSEWHAVMRTDLQNVSHVVTDQQAGRSTLDSGIDSGQTIRP